MFQIIVSVLYAGPDLLIMQHRVSQPATAIDTLIHWLVLKTSDVVKVWRYCLSL
jgi:hypothetical protein